MSVQGANIPETNDFENRPLIWIQAPPKCEENSQILVHLNKPHDFWSGPQGCELLPSGILGMFQHNWWKTLIRWDLASGSWYRCSPKVLSLFEKVETRKTIGRWMPHYAELPPIGISFQELQEFTRKNSEPDIQDGVMVDYP